jgi:hypothetical protein
MTQPTPIPGSEQNQTSQTSSQITDSEEQLAPWAGHGQRSLSLSLPVSSAGGLGGNGNRNGNRDPFSSSSPPQSPSRSFFSNLLGFTPPASSSSPWSSPKQGYDENSQNQWHHQHQRTSSLNSLPSASSSVGGSSSFRDRDGEPKTPTSANVSPEVSMKELPPPMYDDEASSGRFAAHSRRASWAPGAGSYQNGGKGGLFSWLGGEDIHEMEKDVPGQLPEGRGGGSAGFGLLRRLSIGTNGPYYKVNKSNAASHFTTSIHVADTLLFTVDLME